MIHVAPRRHREGFGWEGGRVSGPDTLRLPPYPPPVPKICPTVFTGVTECTVAKIHGNTNYSSSNLVWAFLKVKNIWNIYNMSTILSFWNKVYRWGRQMMKDMNPVRRGPVNGKVEDFQQFTAAEYVKQRRFNSFFAASCRDERLISWVLFWLNYKM